MDKSWKVEAQRRLAASPSFGEWQNNTWENPFWKSSLPVDVEIKGGEVRRLACPKCARGMMFLIIRWRTSSVTTSKLNVTKI